MITKGSEARISILRSLVTLSSYVVVNLVLTAPNTSDCALLKWWVDAPVVLFLGLSCLEGHARHRSFSESARNLVSDLSYQGPNSNLYVTSPNSTYIQKGHTSAMASTELQQDRQNVNTALEAVITPSQLSKVIVGIPCYNEEVAIGSLVLRAFQYADKVVVIDDGSTDKTTQVARLAGAEVIAQESNRGKGAALREFFKYASQQRADIIVILDGDGQHDPKLLAPLLSDEADVVNGSRYLDGDGHSTPRYRRFGQVVLDKFTRVALSKDVDITDTQSGFRAFSIKAVPYFRFNSNRLAIDSEMLMDAAKAQLRIAEVGVTVRYDVGRSSAHPVRHGVQVLAGVFRNAEFKNPLLAFTAPGACLIAAGLAVGVYIINDFLKFGKVVFGPAMLMVLFIVVGTLMAVTGILLHSVSSLASSPEENR